MPRSPSENLGFTSESHPDFEALNSLDQVLTVAQLGQQAKSRQKLNQKNVKLAGHIYAYNSLTNFQYEAHTMTGNGNYENPSKKFVKSHHVNLIFGEFGPFETTVYCHHEFAAKSILYLLILVVF